MKTKQTDVGALESCFDAVGRLVRELDGDLQQADGELGVRLGGDPDAEQFVDVLRFRERDQQFLHELQTQVTVLQKRPAALEHFKIKYRSVYT